MALVSNGSNIPVSNNIPSKKIADPIPTIKAPEVAKTVTETVKYATKAKATKKF